MPLLHFKQKSIFFIHIPKTGGSTLYLDHAEQQGITYEFFGGGDGCTKQHYHIAMLESHFPAYKDFTPFTIFRDPWTRTCSEFCWAKPGFSSWDDINSWIEAALYKVQDRPFHLDNHLRCQTEFVTDQIKVFDYQQYSTAQQYLNNFFGVKLDWSQSSKVGQKNKPDISILQTKVRDLWQNYYASDIVFYEKFTQKVDKE